MSETDDREDADLEAMAERAGIPIEEARRAHEEAKAAGLYGPEDAGKGSATREHVLPLTEVTDVPEL